MGYWLANAADRLRRDVIKRFDPRFWSVNFPRPMMACAVTTASGVRVDLSFTHANDLAGLIWASEDSLDHPLLAYETRRDYRGAALRFRWRSSSGVKPLDAVHGPTLTIEGRDANGQARAWYVRLWNYASGSPTDAQIELEFDLLAGGFLLPQEADPVHAGDIDRMFISMVPASFDGAAAGALPGGPVDAWVELSGISCEGAGAVLPIGDAMVPPHGLRLANGFDDTFNITPERLLRNIVQLGYRGGLVHYVGMSHFPRLSLSGGQYAAAAGSPYLCQPALAWHQDFLARAKALGFSVILSISFELLDSLCPETWKQRAHDGAPALTGWSPPSTLISPCSAAGMAWLKGVFLAFAQLQAAAGLAVKLQIGEPWWWSGLGGSRKPCFYDAFTTAAYTAETGRSLPAPLTSVTQTPNGAQQLYLDWLGVMLGQATLAIRDDVRAAHPAAQIFCLIYLPQILDPGAPMLAGVNIPAAWAYPAFDVLQLEDYEFVTEERLEAQRQAISAVDARLGYPRAASDYFSGFVLNPRDRAQWRLIAAAARSAQRDGFSAVYLWAYPQAMRDGLVVFDEEEAPVNGFHDVRFPLELGFGSTVGPEFSTSVIEAASGYEQRNSHWAQARAHFDVGTGLRSETDLKKLLAFFHARQGQACAFRFRDPLDWRSRDDDLPVTPFDQVLGAGDGARTVFQLVKQYGETRRKILKPVAGSVRVGVAGAEISSGWSLAGGGLSFAVPPAAGSSVTAGFEFDVPVRFAVDRLQINLETFRAGAVPAIPLVEVRDA